MKLQTKLILGFISIVIVTTGFTSYFLNSNIQNRFEEFLDRRDSIISESVEERNGRGDSIIERTQNKKPQPSRIRNFPKDSPEYLFLQSSRKALLQSAGIGILLAILFVFLFTPYYLKRLKRLSLAMDEYGENGTYKKIDDVGNDEITHLVKAYNDLIENIEYQKEVRKSFFIDMSHEIKTPLTSIQGYLQGILDGVFQDDKDITQKTLKETQRLIDMVKEMMNLAKLESQDIYLEKKEVDITVLTQEIIGSLIKDTKDVEILLPEKFMVNIDSDKMKQVFINLLNNALEYRIINTPLKIEVQEKGNKWNWSISNQTNEVQEKDLSFLFQRFYRKDVSRVYKKEENHLGVGLSIVKRIVEAHGGKIDVDIKNNIIVFELVMPI